MDTPVTSAPPPRSVGRLPLFVLWLTTIAIAFGLGALFSLFALAPTQVMAAKDSDNKAVAALEQASATPAAVLIVTATPQPPTQTPIIIIVTATYALPTECALLSSTATKEQLTTRAAMSPTPTLTASLTPPPARTAAPTVEGTARPAATPGAGGTPGSKPPLPQARTATPLPPKPLTLTITGAEAAQQAAAEARSYKLPLQNTTVKFTPPNQIELQGNVTVPIALGQSVSGNIKIQGTLVQNQDKLAVSISSLTFNGSDYTGNPIKGTLERIINGWLEHLLVARHVKSFSIDGAGNLVIDALEDQ